jgi:hypothetical protein
MDGTADDDPIADVELKFGPSPQRSGSPNVKELSRAKPTLCTRKSAAAP